MTERQQQKLDKKPYTAPRLTVYGDIRRLTENAARNTRRDGGSNSSRT